MIFKDLRRIRTDLHKRLQGADENKKDKEIFELKDKIAKLESDKSMMNLDIDKLQNQIEELQRENFNSKKQHHQELLDTKAEIDLKWLRKHEEKLREGIQQGDEM